MHTVVLKLTNMKVFITILAAFVLLSGTHATGTVTNPGEQVIEWIYNVVKNGDISANHPAFNPTLITDDFACLVEYKNMDMTVLKLGAGNLMQCYHISADQIKKVAESKAGSMLMTRYKSNLSQCSGIETVEARLQCVADMTEKFLQAVNIVTMPIQVETKLCQRFEVHRIETGFFKSHMELEKCMMRVKINSMMPAQPQPQPAPQTPQVPSAPLSPMQSAQAAIQAHFGQQ